MQGLVATTEAQIRDLRREKESAMPAEDLLERNRKLLKDSTGRAEALDKEFAALLFEFREYRAAFQAKAQRIKAAHDKELAKQREMEQEVDVLARKVSPPLQVVAPLSAPPPSATAPHQALVEGVTTIFTGPGTATLVEECAALLAASGDEGSKEAAASLRQQGTEANAAFQSLFRCFPELARKRAVADLDQKQKREREEQEAAARALVVQQPVPPEQPPAAAAGDATAKTAEEAPAKDASAGAPPPPGLHPGRGDDGMGQSTGSGKRQGEEAVVAVKRQQVLPGAIKSIASGSKARKSSLLLLDLAEFNAEIGLSAADATREAELDDKAGVI